MTSSNLHLVLDSFSFQKGDYYGAQKQLLNFAENYHLLEPTQASELRQRYDAKTRLGWFRIATSLFKKQLNKADYEEQQRLLQIFCAFYSFQNLDFGYDALMDVTAVFEMARGMELDFSGAWEPYKFLTSNALAVENFEKNFF